MACPAIPKSIPVIHSEDFEVVRDFATIKKRPAAMAASFRKSRSPWLMWWLADQ
jgi:hypothetical protein